MTEYRLMLKATNINGEKWLIKNEFDYDYAEGVSELKQLLSEIEKADGVEVDVIFKYKPYGCFDDVTSRYVKK